MIKIFQKLWKGKVINRCISHKLTNTVGMSEFHTQQLSDANKSTFDYHGTVVYDFQAGKTPLEVHTVWLRHHCQCQLCFNIKTHQRTKIPSVLPSVSTVAKFKCEKHKLIVLWDDGHESQFDVSWLRKYAPKPQNEALQTFYHREVITSKYLETLKIDEMFNHFKVGRSDPIDSAISFKDFMKEGNEGVSHLLSTILKLGYGIVKECPPDFSTTNEVISKVSHPQNTFYGGVIEWTSNLAHADTAYTADFIHLHTDTSYFTEPMGLQIFHCLQHEGTGGINFLADGFQIARQIALNNFESYKQLASVNVPGQYIDTGKHHFHSNDVIIGHNWLTGKIHKIRYNPHDMAVLGTLAFENVAQFYESLVNFSNLLENSPQPIKLTPGLIIFLDNWRTLHGRSAFTGLRRLCGAYISRSDWLSQARRLGILHN